LQLRNGHRVLQHEPAGIRYLSKDAGSFGGKVDGMQIFFPFVDATAGLYLENVALLFFKQ